MSDAPSSQERPEGSSLRSDFNSWRPAEGDTIRRNYDKALK